MYQKVVDMIHQRAVGKLILFSGAFNCRRLCYLIQAATAAKGESEMKNPEEPESRGDEPTEDELLEMLTVDENGNLKLRPHPKLIPFFEREIERRKRETAMKYDRRLSGAEKMVNSRKQPEPHEQQRAHDELITRANRGDTEAIKQGLERLSESELAKLYLDSGGDPVWWIAAQQHNFKGEDLQ
jgi:hypothetical protein